MMGWTSLWVMAVTELGNESTAMTEDDVDGLLYIYERDVARIPEGADAPPTTREYWVQSISSWSVCMCGGVLTCARGFGVRLRRAGLRCADGGFVEAGFAVSCAGSGARAGAASTGRAASGDYILKLMNFVLKLMNFALNMMNFVLKMMNFESGPTRVASDCAMIGTSISSFYALSIIKLSHLQHVKMF